MQEPDQQGKAGKNSEKIEPKKIAEGGSECDRREETCEEASWLLS